MTDTEMNVPDGWKATELGKLLVEWKKSGLKVSDAANFGQYPFFTSGEAVLQHTAKQVEGDNIYLATGGVANIKYFSGEAAYSTDTYTVSTSKDVETEYLYFNLLDILYYINANYFQGSGLKHLQKKDFKKHLIRYPESADEQRQIARILSKVDESISQTEQLIAKYRRLKTGLMQDLLTKGIDAHGNIRSEETHAFKDSPLGRIPVEWGIETLEKLLADIPNNMRSGPFGSALTKSEWVESGIPYLGIDNVQKEKFVAVYNRHISTEKYNQLIRYSVNPSDVMITIMGTVGRSCVVPEGVGEAISSKHVWTMSFDKERYVPELISYQLNYSPWILKAMREDTQGGVMPSINSVLLKKLKFPVPAIDEQKLIFKRYSSIQEFLNRLSNSLGKSKSLKNGLMQDLLSGKVRVEQLLAETIAA